MRQFLLRLFLGSISVLGNAATMQGQQARDSTEYDERALRIESDYGAWNLVRGKDGILVKKLGSWRGDVDISGVLAPSENALREARDFNSNYHRGWWKVTAGILAITAGRLVDQLNDGPAALELSATGATVAGLLVAVYGGQQVYKAHRALARAIWWYNRDLAR